MYFFSTLEVEKKCTFFPQKMAATTKTPWTPAEEKLMGALILQQFKANKKLTPGELKAQFPTKTPNQIPGKQRGLMNKMFKHGTLPNLDLWDGPPLPGSLFLFLLFLTFSLFSFFPFFPFPFPPFPFFSFFFFSPKLKQNTFFGLTKARELCREQSRAHDCSIWADR
jgi:hypothetical protein